MPGKKVNILLVEDEEAHAEAVKRAFQQADSAAELTWAFSLEQASAFLQESSPDLVITDWLLPDGKATDILPAEKELFPVILMTSQGSEQLAVEAMKAGILDYVVKSPTVFADMPHIAERALKQWELLIQKKRSEEKLRESEERFRTVFEQGPLGMYIAGMDYRFLGVNPSFCRIIGYRQDELKDLTFLDITSPEDRDADAAQVATLLEGELPHYKTEKRLVKKQGEIVWIDLTRSIVRSAEGRPLYFLTMIEDITERKNAEKLSQLRAEELARSNEDLERFAYVASHDLQEPLRNVASCLQMLEQIHAGKLGGESDQLIQYAVDSAKRMKMLITGLLDYSRISTRGGPLQNTASEEALGKSLLNLQYVISSNNTTVTNDPLPKVPADPVQLLQIFQNLIANAINYRRDESPRIHVSAVKNGTEWIFSVEDNGIGIEKRHFDRIFEIFQQLSRKGLPESTGMGLAIVKKIVERHQGRVWVESQVGAGSTFYFTIPDKNILSLSSTRSQE